MKYSLKDKSILITGASRGLGRALAIQLARAGSRVSLVGRGADALAEVAREIRSAGGVAVAIQADVGAKGDIHAIAAQAAELTGPVNVLINNASILGRLPMPILLDTECEDFEAVLQANLLGPFRLAKAVIGPMIFRGGGIVLNLSSDAAFAAYPGWGAYGVSKAALDHLARIWAAELQGTAIKVLSVDPGEMDTRMHSEAIPGADRALLLDPGEVASRIIRLLERSPAIAGGSRLLASDFKALRPLQKAAL